MFDINLSSFFSLLRAGKKLNRFFFPLFICKNSDSNNNERLYDNFSFVLIFSDASNQFKKNWTEVKKKSRILRWRILHCNPFTLQYVCECVCALACVCEYEPIHTEYTKQLVLTKSYESWHHTRIHRHTYM